ncbi:MULTISPECIES: hypothetical protein [unclassified Collinsella]|uniref:hypothetical protein n=1 Tax=unclassified Collinsella TaxID=2637548 RepID=UPI000E52903F|nr:MULTISPECIES: hypothetical protein [unclassified Collinsella]RHJ40809.1 hypothetical protein DW129_00810 [Collinsella sp. AM10-48]RHJ41793.1 hypothetical protein DW126_00815 [Collinsella sp. AM10-32]RHJ46529.1 hypothetical protein DW124_00860 [Collinsella sp. AM10-27]RHJ46997.1 hypothetical protein DW123_00815 [Collinsella sp. AM10-26]RHJ56031.1 hypothetical protein DW117_00815 [Collinsella sp. AM10-11]
MTLKMDSKDGRIGRSVSMGEMVSFPGVMPPSSNRRGGNRGERDDEGFDLSGFYSRLVSGLDRVMETSVLEAPRVLKTGMPVDDALGGGIGLGKLSVIGGAHEDVSNVLVYATLRLSEQCAVLYAPIREREEDAIARLVRAEMNGKVSEDPEEQQVETIRATMRLKQRNLGIFAEDNMTMDLLTSWLLGDQTWNRAVLENIVVVIDGLEMLDDNRPVNAILRDLRNMLSPTAAILAGCFAAGDRNNDAVFAEAHCNADALVRMSPDGAEPFCMRVFG